MAWLTACACAAQLQRARTGALLPCPHFLLRGFGALWLCAARKQDLLAAINADNQGGSARSCAYLEALCVQHEPAASHVWCSTVGVVCA